MRCELSPQAVADLEEIGDYIARDNPQRAASFVAELLAHTHRIAERTEAFPARPELSEGLRSCAHQRYVIFFTASPERVRIERIIHGCRKANASPSDSPMLRYLLDTNICIDVIKRRPRHADRGE